MAPNFAPKFMENARTSITMFSVVCTYWKPLAEFVPHVFVFFLHIRHFIEYPLGKYIFKRSSKCTRITAMDIALILLFTNRFRLWSVFSSAGEIANIGKDFTQTTFIRFGKVSQFCWTSFVYQKFVKNIIVGITTSL